MSKVKKQHYLPQFYLRNFADEKGRLCVVDSNVDAPIYKSRVQDVAQGRYYYDFLGDGDNQTLEKMFSKMEDLIAPYFSDVLGLAADGGALRDVHKHAVHKFLELQFLRSDWMRQKIDRDFVEKFFKPNYVEHAEPLLHAHLIKERFMVELLEYIPEYEFLILTAKNQGSLFTSSFPMFFNNEGDVSEVMSRLIRFKHDGIGRLNCNLFFPISSDYCLYIYDSSKPTEISDDNWFGSFVTSGLSWSNKRIYFRDSDMGRQLYPVVKPLLGLIKN